MGAAHCAYYVAYSPDNCDLQAGDIIFLQCDCFCSDIVISDGPCQGAYLIAIDGDCVS